MVISRKPRRKLGQGLLEFAIIAPLLLVLLFGIFEISRLLFIFISVTMASRQGARFGSAAGETPQYMDCAGIRAAARGVGFLAGIDDTEVDIQYDDGVSIISSSCPPAGLLKTGDRIIVSVSVNFEPILPIPVLPSGFPIQSITKRTILQEVVVDGGIMVFTPIIPPTYTSTPTPTRTNTPESPFIANNHLTGGTPAFKSTANPKHTDIGIGADNTTITPTPDVDITTGSVITIDLTYNIANPFEDDPTETGNVNRKPLRFNFNPDNKLYFSTFEKIFSLYKTVPIGLLYDEKSLITAIFINDITGISCSVLQLSPY